jgi:TP901 family phage tail tape measure protein
VSTSTLSLIIQGNSSSLTAAAHAGGHSLQGLNAQAHGVGAGMQQMGGNTTVAANGLHLFGAAANAAAHSASNLATHAGQAFRAVGRLSHQAAQGVLNKYTALGASVGTGFVLWRGATLDRTLLRIKRTAGATKAQADQIRNDLMKMSVESGTPVEELVGSFSTMIQSGQSWDSAKGAVGAINQAVALTGANADDLARSLAVAGETFNFDLTKPGKALELLDKMLIAGDLGSAEIEDLSDIFAKVGANAKAANFTMDQTLALTEALSKVEKNKERLGTLTDSTLRMFTNQKYMIAAAKATGVKFYDKDGARRDPVKVLSDMVAAYKKLNTEKQRNNFVAKAWGETDAETIKGIRTLLNGNALTDLQQYVEKIQKAPGEIKNKMGEGMGNAASQLERLKESLKKLGDEAARPVNEVIAKYSKLAADHQELTRGLVIGAGILVAAAATFVAAMKVRSAWQTISGVFGGGAGAGGAGGGLGGIGLGASPANPMYVYVVNSAGGSPTVPGGPVVPPGTVASGAGWGSRLLGWGRSAAQLGLRGLRFANGMIGGTLIGGALAAYDEGGITKRWAARMLGQTLGAAIGGKVPIVGGIIGRYIGDEASQALYDGVQDAPEKERKAAEKVANEEADRIWGLSRYSGIDYMRGRTSGSDRLSSERPPVVASPINLTIVNNVDESGRIDTRIEPGVGSPGLLNTGNVLRPQWVLPK